MKNKINIIISAFLFAITFSACYEDKGNYDYKELGQIDLSGIDNAYNRIAYQDVLHIEPKVTSSDPEDSFSYLWTINKKYDPSGVQKEITADTIGEEQVLDYPVNIPNGSYDVTLHLKNIKTGIETFYVVSLNVATKFMDGFYLLKDVNGSAELDFHLPDNSIITDILGKSMEGRVFAKPVSLGINHDYMFIDPGSGEYVVTKSVNVCTENDVYVLNVVDMTPIFTHSTMFWDENVPEEKPYYMWNNYFCAAYTSDQGIYFSYQSSSQGTMGSGKFSLPILQDGEKVVPSKYGVFYSLAYFFFDELNRRFANMDYHGGLWSYSDRGGPEGMDYSPNGIQHKLIYFGLNNIARTPIGYAIFEDADMPEKHYLYTLDLDPNIMNNPILSVIEIARDSKFNKASLYATNELQARVIYCATDNQLYMYDVAQDKEELISPQEFESGEEITYLCNYYWTQTDDVDNNFNYLVIGTYKAGKYKVYFYETLGGKPYGKPVRILKGDGKVVKMRFASSKMNGESGDCYPGSF